MRVFCVLVPGGGGPPARPARSARPLGVCAASRPLGPPACRPLRELPACRPRSLCSLACLRVGAWGRRPARSPSAPRASLGASSRSPARPCRRPPAPQPGPPAASALALVGFSIRSLLVACRRRVGPSRSEIPPFGGGEVAVRGGVVLKVQTTSAKNAENGLLWARWSAFWAQRRLAGCVVRTRTRCCER